MNLRGVAEQRKKTGWQMMAFLNHPNFGWGVRAEDMVLAEELRFFEVFNGHPAVRNYGDETHASCERIWDIVLALRLGKHKLPHRLRPGDGRRARLPRLRRRQDQPRPRLGDGAGART